MLRQLHAFRSQETYGRSLTFRIIYFLRVAEDICMYRLQHQEAIMKVLASLSMQAQQDQVSAFSDLWSGIIHQPDTIPRHRFEVVF